MLGHSSEPLDSAELHGDGHPIFELIEPERHLKIYANGVVEGASEDAFIVNSIGIAIRPEFWRYYSKRLPASNVTSSSDSSGVPQGSHDRLPRSMSAEHSLAAVGEK